MSNLRRQLPSKLQLQYLEMELQRESVRESIEDGADPDRSLARYLREQDRLAVPQSAVEEK